MMLLFKVKRRFYFTISPFLAFIFSKFGNININKMLFVGIPLLEGNIFIKSGVLVSLWEGNPIGVNCKCMLRTSSSGSIHIGENFQASGVTIYANKNVSIGNNVFIGPEVKIIDSDFHPVNYLERKSYQQTFKSSSINIGDDVWIGTRVLILKGVSIGSRSIIGAGVVLRKSVPDDCIVTMTNSNIIVSRVAEESKA